MPRKKKTTEEFIEEAKKIHGNKYDYSKVKYNGNHNKVYENKEELLKEIKNARHN